MAIVTKGHPMWCSVYARKTPAIPVHNGLDKCLGCGFDVAAYRRGALVDELREAGQVANSRPKWTFRALPRQGGAS